MVASVVRNIDEGVCACISFPSHLFARSFALARALTRARPPISAVYVVAVVNGSLTLAVVDFKEREKITVTIF